MTLLEQNILTKTRAEEHEADVWGEFYIPPYFDRLGLKTATKSTYIVGKRGCGKTMLLKYLDYHTAFSSKRERIEDEEIRHIGIYWRVDTQFCNALHHRGLSEHEWITIFESYFSLVIAIEIIKALDVISKSRLETFTTSEYKNFRFESVSDFEAEYPSTPYELEKFLESKRRKFSMWCSNISSTTKPLMPPGKIFLEALISDIRAILGFENAAFFIYVDEVENLVPYQRRVLNSFLKHSQPPLIVSFTSKELSNETATTGPESINATHDFRLLLLDELVDEESERIFFAEVFLANMDLVNGTPDSELVSTLKNVDSLPLRKTEEYRTRIFDIIRKRFPRRSFGEFAADALTENRILTILKERISKVLKLSKSRLTCDDFMAYIGYPEALIIVPALLNRSRNTPELILDNLKKYSQKTENSFEKNWIHNNLVGAILELYRPYGSLCPIYSGFDTYATLANNNLRHFLILCYKALEVAELSDESLEEISYVTQARAAQEAADQLIREIKTFGSQGERLRMFVLRIGNVFRGLQAMPAMSEPEQNQFTINAGSRALNDNEILFLAEAKKYGILVEKLETKTKNTIGSDIIDYQLNPIYSPYFQISYRRKRKIDLSVEEFHILALGTENEYKEFANRRINKPSVEPEQKELW